MGDRSLEGVNLNHIPVLRFLLKERSVSGAAAALGRSPSTVSEALTQLRITLDDQLLMRVGSHLKLTPKAALLVEPLEELHKNLQAFFTSHNFDASTSKRAFTIASSDLLILELGGAMTTIIRKFAPGMSINFVEVSRGLTDRMAEREIDFVLLPDFAIQDLAPAPIKFIPLKEVATKALMDRDHPLSRFRSVSKQQLQDFQHIAFRPDPVLLDGRRKLQPIPGQEYEGSRNFSVIVTVNNFLTIPSLLKDTDLVAVVPTGVANLYSSDADLTAATLNYKIAPSKFGLAWSPLFDNDETHSWFRQMLVADRNKRDEDSRPNRPFS